MNRYEKENSLNAIDGYWSPRHCATDKSIAEDFERAKQEYRDALTRYIENVNEITLEQFRQFKGRCWPSSR